MRIFTNCPQPAGLMLSKPLSIEKGGFACQWYGIADMHMYAKYDQNTVTPELGTFSLTANERTHKVIIV